ncbi:Deoxyuridine 5'-triphosphate nucleotidohydrolase [compost metagenome]
MLQMPYYSESDIQIIYGTEDSAGLDLPIWDKRLIRPEGMTDEEFETWGPSKEDMVAGTITLEPMGRFIVKTGVYMAIPKGYFGSLDTRSSTSKIAQDLLCHTIDADYRGNIRLAVINLNTEPVTLRNGQAIAQIIIQKYEKVKPEQQTSLEEFLVAAGQTARGANGWGHTGRNLLPKEGE